MEVCFIYDSDYMESLKEGDLENVGHILMEKWGENEVKVLDLISRNNKISIVSIAEETKLSTSGVEKVINRLKEQGVLKRVGSAKGGYWEISK